MPTHGLTIDKCEKQSSLHYLLNSPSTCHQFFRSCIQLKVSKSRNSSNVGCRHMKHQGHISQSQLHYTSFVQQFLQLLCLLEMPLDLSFDSAFMFALALINFFVTSSTCFIHLFTGPFYILLFHYIFLFNSPKKDGLLMVDLDKVNTS